MSDISGIEQRAKAYCNNGQIAEARRELELGLAQHPEAFALRCLLGWVNQIGGHLDAARREYEQALDVAPPSIELCHNLGVVCHALGDLPSARRYFERALLIQPGALPSLSALAGVAQESGEVAVALGCYERILQIDPLYAAAYLGMGSAFSDAGWDEDALRSFETALSIDSSCLEALNGLGLVCMRLGRSDAAMAAFDQALQISPTDPALLRNRAMLLGMLGRYPEAEACYRQGIAAAPEDADLHFGLACACLITGNLAEGWREYEYRWRSAERDTATMPPTTILPRWLGEPVERERSALVIYAEQGFGDAIQFSRYFPLVAARFGKVLVHTRRPLISLFQRSFGEVAEVVAEVTDESAYTHHCPLLSLPLALGTELATIPADIPYLVGDPEKMAYWAARLADERRLKVGIVWSTGKRGLHKRSFELSPERLAPLLGAANVAWLSLNKEAPDDRQRAIIDQYEVVDWTAALADFDDTAALIAALDLVISVDTAVAHLAGALGKPVWLLNRAESEWRWLLERSDSPWYPSMRIFRQRRTRDWREVLDEVADALRSLSVAR